MKCADVNVFHKVGGTKNSDRNYTSWLNLYKNKVYVMKKHFSYGFWLLFFTIALIVNAINIQNTHSKRKAATETLFKLPILLWKSRFI
jgi:GT2 family glycosyltransferase